MIEQVFADAALDGIAAAPVGERRARALLRSTAWASACFALVLCGGALAQPPQPPSVARASLFEAGPADVVEDAGVMVVSGGRTPRTETFEVLRRADGGRVVTSIIEAADGAWRVEGRWTYNADEQAVSAVGLGSWDGQPVGIEIVDAGAEAIITASVGGETERDTAPCEPCLMDMAPSALPMFTMARLYDAAAGGVQSFHWIGRALTRDEVLTDGVVDLRLVQSRELALPDGRSLMVRQLAFTETLTDAATGRSVSLDFNLYVDAEQRPLAFAMRHAAGVRQGFEAVLDLLPPVLDAVPAAPPQDG
jgi:hypothetical protein